jgi:predicted metal-binding protein
MGENRTKPESIAVIRCETASEVCPGTRCFSGFYDRKFEYKDYGPDVRLASVFTCGGCPGRRVSRLLEKLSKEGVKTVHLASCIVSAEPHHYPPCPHIDDMREIIESRGMKVVEGTYVWKGRCQEKGPEE